MNRDICDGTQWELEIDYGDRKIKSFGSNAYPGSTDESGLQETPAFEAFRQALESLLGGLKII